MKTKKSKIVLRYGENPNQKGYLISDKKNSIFNYQISGKQISYNNLIDIEHDFIKDNTDFEDKLKEYNENEEIFKKLLPLIFMYKMSLNSNPTI